MSAPCTISTPSIPFETGQILYLYPDQCAVNGILTDDPQSCLSLAHTSLQGRDVRMIRDKSLIGQTEFNCPIKSLSPAEQSNLHISDDVYGSIRGRLRISGRPIHQSILRQSNRIHRTHVENLASVDFTLLDQSPSQDTHNDFPQADGGSAASLIAYDPADDGAAHIELRYDGHGWFRTSWSMGSIVAALVSADYDASEISKPSLSFHDSRYHLQVLGDLITDATEVQRWLQRNGQTEPGGTSIPIKVRSLTARNRSEDQGHSIRDHEPTAEDHTDPLDGHASQLCSDLVKSLGLD